jgi:positive phototaxis protein PixI
MAAYLEISLNHHHFLVDMTHTHEVLNLATGAIVPVANMPMEFLGLLGYRSRVYWAIDLGIVLGLEPLPNLDKYAVIMMVAGDRMQAIATATINGIHQLSAPLQPIDINNTPKQLIPFLEGKIDRHLILNPEAVLSSLAVTAQ